MVVNGPAIAAQGDQLAVAWFTMANEEPKVQLAFSGDGGAHFSEPIRIDDGDPQGRVDIVWKDKNSVLVSWIEAVDEKGEIRLAKVDRSKIKAPSLKVTDIDLARKSGFPILEQLDEQTYLIAWTEVGTTTKIRTDLISWPN